MKTGDLVEFKAGLFGLQAPLNMAIYLERTRKKGQYWAVIHTMKGRQEVKPDHLSARRLSARVDDASSASPTELTARLKQLIDEVSKGTVREVRRVEEDADDRALWLSVKEEADRSDGAPMSVEAIAAAYLGTREPTRPQVGDIRKLLETCRSDGIGYFEREKTREELWRPLTRAQHVSFHQTKDRLNRVRKKLVLVQEVEDDEGYLQTVYEGVKPAAADLDHEDLHHLDFVAAAMEDFVLHDGPSGKLTYGTSGKHTLDGESLARYLKFLAIDWTGAQKVSLSSTYVEFLVASGLRSVEQAIHLIARRGVQLSNGFGWDMPANIVAAAERAPAEITPAMAATRIDLRDQPCYTIDPPDARDHDDAVGLTEHPDGSTDLWVHIADVAHYVDKDGTLDMEARKRATSVYLPTGVLPMLPPRLSNDLCSLEPQQDRLAMTVRVRVDADGHIVEEEAMESLIRVAANVPYDDVLAQIESGHADNTDNPFVKLRALADRLDRHRRGLSIETSERRVHLSPDGVDHVEKAGNRATRMIETFMVTANEAVARILTRADVPLPYRCHPLPDRAAVDRFNGQCATMDVDIAITLPQRPGTAHAESPNGAENDANDNHEDDGENGGMSVLDQLKSGKMQMFGGGSFTIKGATPEPEPEPNDTTNPPAAADSADAAPMKPLVDGYAQLSESEQIAWMTPFRDALDQIRTIEPAGLKGLVFLKSLGCMGRAFYTTGNFGHFGLGSACYAHFTSPIRRYPDVVVHRQLKWHIRGADPENVPYDAAAIERVAEHCSDQSADAERLERSVVDAALVFASQDARWAGPQRALAASITKAGIFMALEGGLEARVATSDIPGGPYNVDEWDSQLFVSDRETTTLNQEIDATNWRQMIDPKTDEIRKVRIRLGDSTQVTLTNRDYVNGRVAAKLAEHTTEN